MTETRNIKILQSIYSIEVTTYSNNHLLKCFCYDCLSISKTNKEYKDYQSYPTLSNQRICAKCGAMTIPAVIAAFNLSLDMIISYIKEKHLYKDTTLDIKLQFEIDPIYLLSLKRNMKHG